MNDRNDTSRPRDNPRRTDPVLGNLDQLDAEGRARARGREKPSPPFTTRVADDAVPARWRRWWPVVVVVVVLLGAGAWAWSNQSMLRGLLPQTRLNTLLTRADAALAAGDLSAGPDSARDLYGAARALDPDNEHARAGLHKVGEAELARARQALGRHDYADARASLEEARSLLGGGTEVDAIDKALAKAVLKSANIDVLISQARAALAHGQIDGARGAAALFGQVLAGDPHNAVAQHGMDKVGDALATRIHAQLAKPDRAAANQTLAQLAHLVPRYAQLPSLRADVAAANRAADAQRDKYLAQAEADLRAGKVAGAGADNALAGFKAALAIDPGNARAEAGLGQVAEALIVQANAEIEAGRSDAAGQLLDEAATLAPKSADLAAARSRLAAGAGAAQASSAGTVATISPPQSAKVARLVARAEAAARKGDIMLPPGESAYDLYRAALGIDGDDARAQAGLQALPQLAGEKFHQALRHDNLGRARDMLGTLEQLAPGDPALAAMRRQLGDAWLQRADAAAAAGRNAAARTALEEARQLIPHDPRIGDVSARIQAGQGSSE